MAAEKVSQTRTASLLSFLVSPRLTVALRGSPPSGSSLESFSLELLVLRGARNKRIRYEFASPRSFFRAPSLSPSRLDPADSRVIPNALGSVRNLRIFAQNTQKHRIIYALTTFVHLENKKNLQHRAIHQINNFFFNTNILTDM